MSTSFSWLNTDAETAAKHLLSCELVREIDGCNLHVRIVETEAYDENDPASHCFNGRTKRNDTMFRSAGHLYVYFTYGMHYCCNISCGPEGFGSGVLLRAVEPLEGVERMEQLRGVSGKQLTNGPGKLAQALGVDRSLDGHFLMTPPLTLVKHASVASETVVATTRIGIRKNVEAVRRFYLKDSAYVSRR